MDDYSHHVSGFFAHREEAEGTRSRLAGLRLPLERIQLSATTLPGKKMPRRLERSGRSTQGVQGGGEMDA